jgi:hypothetical protein
MCPQLPRLSPEYSHKVGLQTVITGMPLQIRPVTHGGLAGPVTTGRNARGPLSWTRPHCGKPFVASLRLVRYTRRVSLSVLSLLAQLLQRRLRAKGGAFCLRPNSANSSALGWPSTTACILAASLWHIPGVLGRPTGCPASRAWSTSPSLLCRALSAAWAAPDGTFARSARLLLAWATSAGSPRACWHWPTTSWLATASRWPLLGHKHVGFELQHNDAPATANSRMVYGYRC